MIRFFDFLLRWYQKTLSPDHGMLSGYFPYGYCRFVPSCSMYARHALVSHGVLRGTGKVFLRLLRCNPFSSGGFDSIKQ